MDDRESELDEITRMIAKAMKEKCSDALSVENASNIGLMQKNINEVEAKRALLQQQGE